MDDSKTYQQGLLTTTLQLWLLQYNPYHSGGEVLDMKACEVGPHAITKDVDCSFKL